MGSTIRRTPVSYNIPAKPKYKFSNIVDFGGLQITDNPLIAPTNTASDMLNVYVDETNALTTRPRLEKKYDYSASEILLGKQILKAYPLVDGFLIHCKSGTPATYSLYIHRENTISSVSDSNALTPTTSFSYFENNEIVYIIDGVNYLQIKNNVLSEVDGYVPTAKIAVQKYDTETGNSYYENGIDYESLNLMSDKYAQLFFWDGISEAEYPTDNLVDVENNYIKQFNSSEKRIIGVGNDKTIVARDVALHHDSRLIYYIYNETNFSWDEHVSNDYVRYNTVRMAKNTNLLIGLSSAGVWYKEFDFVDKIYKTKGNFNNHDGLNVDEDGINMWVSDDGKIVVIGGIVYRISIDPDYSANSYLTQVYLDELDSQTYYQEENNNYLVCAGDGGNGSVAVKIYKNDFLNAEGSQQSQLSVWKSFSFNTGAYLNKTSLQYVRATMLNENTVIVTTQNYFRIYDISSTPVLKHKINFYFTGYSIDRKNLNLIVYYTNQQKTEVRIYDLNNPTEFYYTIAYLPVEITITDFYTDKILFYTTPKTIVMGHCVKMIYSNSQWKVVVDSDYACAFSANQYQESTEPKIKVIYRIQNLSETYNKWTERKTKFLSSTLTKRWNNEQWFGSGNTLFRTVNNDPTYIGLTSFTELGDSERPITGFNVAQDNLFLVYKNDNLYSVQYGEVLEDTYDYLYTETKNNVGNDAPGNCIVSVLTEMPLQVSYDGIYALNQLKDVATSDRICMPISENINPRWLKETKQAISNCITLNRLYWTYFILVYNKDDYGVNYNKEMDFVGTKVYLLDNRNGQWYYWELPIITTNAFSKDNETHFVDEDGKLYVLKTTDIINKYNNEVTEYYDDGEKLIPWKWTSQIMPLGTINYSKRLIDTTFILTDTDTVDEYGLMYKFRSFRKMASQTGENTISNKLNYIQSVTKKTLIPRCNFIQLELSNIDEDLNNNKLRLVGLGFRYVLLEGLY